MKYIHKFFILFFVFGFSACDLNISNPNAATENETLGTVDGLFALAHGMERTYATGVVHRAILTPGTTTREVAAMTTFSSLEELEDGGPELSGENERVSRLFSNTLRVKGMAESILENVSDVDMLSGSKVGIKSLATLYRAMCLGIIAQNWEQVPILNDLEGNASFADRMDAYREAIAIIEAILPELEATELSNEYTGRFGHIDLHNTLTMFLARYYLFSGQHVKASTTADLVDVSATPSYFLYDNQNPNPAHEIMFVGTVQYAPRDSFGLPASLPLDAGDGRIDFFLEVDSSLSVFGLHVEGIKAPFFQSETASIPYYYPGEALLIKAEALARNDDLENAEIALNELRHKTATEDALGIGAGLSGDYTAGGDKNALLNEIFKNRRIELFMAGTSLEDSRRFNRPEPPTNPVFTSERNRNFYPYPLDERLNNPNTPDDPSI